MGQGDDSGEQGRQHSLLLTHNELFFRPINLYVAAAAAAVASFACPDWAAEEVNELRNQKA